jgi:archaeal type IV pilus assembly protein PilA
MPSHRNENAVSETIATVLVVALTVIMASLIAAYLFGMMNGVPQTYMISVTADQPDSSHAIVTYRGGPDQKILSNLTIFWPDGISSQKIDSPKVGDIYRATNIGAIKNVTPGRDHIIVSATFADKRQQVVLDTYV